MTKHIPIYAHRGASAYAIENSIEAFEKAIALYADGIELDVQRSKDDGLYVFHDVNLKRLAGVDRFIHECNAEELKGLRIGKGFFRRFGKSRIPKFEDVLQWAGERDIPLNIELKESLIDHMELIIKLLQEHLLPKGSHVSSFHDSLLHEVKEHCPYVETAIIVTKKFDWPSLQNMRHIDAVHAHKRYYKPRFLQVCEEAGKCMRFYGIEGKEPFLQYPHPIVAGWITDYPDRLVEKRIKR